MPWELQTLGGGGGSTGLAANHCCLHFLFFHLFCSLFPSGVTRLPPGLIIHWGNLAPLSPSFSILPPPKAYLSQEREGGWQDCAEA